MRTTIRILCITALAAMCFAGTAALAMPESQYFVQDNFLVTFGVPGNPLAAQTNVQTYGLINRLVYWNVSQTAAYFSLNATAGSAGTIDGGIGTLVFDSGTFTITTETGGGGDVLWTGSVQNLVLRSYVDGTPFAASDYTRPTYDNQPLLFEGVGSGSFVRTGGLWTDQRLVLDWFGTYDTNLDADGTTASGDLQGRLITPEPGAVAGLLCGLVGITGFAARRKRI